jgi:glycosyltransferase involved in cell wall biosynthesis
MNGAGPSVSVVTATRNRRERLAALLESLEAQTYSASQFEVVVIDDGSEDGTAELLDEAARSGRLQLRYAVQQKSGGPAAARNRGWRMAQAPLIAFTDDDCVATPGWIEALVSAEAGGGNVIVQGPTRPNPDEVHRLSAYAKTVNVEGPTPHFETCNVLYPRAVLERVGGFDESYPAPAGEDSDLGIRSLQSGALRAFADDALVYHAVHGRKPIEGLKDALLATAGVQSYKVNPALREHLTQGVFYDRSHPLLLQSAYALWLARRAPAAAALAGPYAFNLRSRCRAAGVPLSAAPYFVAYDVVQLAATVRGAIRHRTFIV